jgi:hypothetical protein
MSLPKHARSLVLSKSCSTSCRAGLRIRVDVLLQTRSRDLVQRAHAAEERVKHLSLRSMAMRSQLQAQRSELVAKRARLHDKRATLDTHAGLLARVSDAVEDVKQESGRVHTAHEIAVGGLRERQARELAALQGVLPVRISGVAKRSKKSMQVRNTSCGKRPRIQRPAALLAQFSAKSAF